MEQDIPDGSYVNLGIGLPTLVADVVPADREIVYHSENGILGMGPAPAPGTGDPELINAGSCETDIATLIRERHVRKIICSSPRSAGSVWFEKFWRAGEIELELVPQGTLSERMRAAGAGLGGFFTPAGADSPLAQGKEVRVIGGRRHVFEEPLHADVALIKADRADRWGNLVYRSAERNFGPVMATAAALTVAQVRAFVELGDLDPEAIVTPGIFVDRVVTT